jgi:hypothetical protein
MNVFEEYEIFEQNKFFITKLSSAQIPLKYS